MVLHLNFVGGAFEDFASDKIFQVAANHRTCKATEMTENWSKIAETFLLVRIGPNPAGQVSIGNHMNAIDPLWKPLCGIL